LDISFAAGSIAAAFAQGLVLGALLQEIRVRNFEFAGAPLDWLTPFSLLCACAMVVAYALLGATWLMMKTEAGVRQRARRLALPLLLALMACIAIVSIWTPLALPRIRARWFSLPNLLFLSEIPLAALLLFWGCWHGIRKDHALLPFFCAVGLFLLAYLGLVVSNLPYLVPPSISIWQAASHPASQMFYLIGASILLPMILVYTALVFWLFRGKVRAGEGYH
jgi:cytochrome d ubiquinol oxidase subunit II